MNDSSPAVSQQVNIATLPLLSTQDVVQILQVSATTVGRWAKKGKLPIAQRTVGGKRKYRLADVLALQNEFCQQAGKRNPETKATPRQGRRLGLLPDEITFAARLISDDSCSDEYACQMICQA